MLFSSTLFLFVFLPLVLGTYFLAQKKNRNLVLLIASVLFYGYGEPKFIYVLFLSIAVNYGLARLMDRYREERLKRRWVLAVDILLNLSLLFVCKYLNFTIFILDGFFHDLLPQTQIRLPIGISFFTFQAMSYAIDVYRGAGGVQREHRRVYGT